MWPLSDRHVPHDQDGHRSTGGDVTHREKPRDPKDEARTSRIRRHHTRPQWVAGDRTRNLQINGLPDHIAEDRESSDCNGFRRTGTFPVPPRPRQDGATDPSMSGAM